MAGFKEVRLKKHSDRSSGGEAGGYHMQQGAMFYLSQFLLVDTS